MHSSKISYPFSLSLSLFPYTSLSARLDSTSGCREKSGRQWEGNEKRARRKRPGRRRDCRSWLLNRRWNKKERRKKRRGMEREGGRGRRNEALSGKTAAVSVVYASRARISHGDVAERNVRIGVYVLVQDTWHTSNERHDVRILIIEALICTTSGVWPAKWRRIYLCHLNNVNKYRPARV